MPIRTIVNSAAQRVVPPFATIQGVSRRMKHGYSNIFGVQHRIFSSQQWDPVSRMVYSGSSTIGDISRGVEVRADGIYFVGYAWASMIAPNGYITAYNGIRFPTSIVGTHTVQAVFDMTWWQYYSNSRRHVEIGPGNSEGIHTAVWTRSSSTSGNNTANGVVATSTITTTEAYPYIIIYAVGQDSYSDDDWNTSVLLKSFIIDGEEFIYL